MRIHKQLLIYLCLLFLAQNLLAQNLTPQWIAQKGGSTFMTNVNVRQSVTDASGNTYTVGNFTNTT